MGSARRQLVGLVAVLVVLAIASAGDDANRQCETSSGGACADDSGLVQLNRGRGQARAANPCLGCDVCVAVPNPTQTGVTDDKCALCARGGQTWWPCDASPAQCMCGGDGPSPSPTPAPVPTPVQEPTPVP